MDTKILILAATPPSILIVFGAISWITGNAWPFGEQAKNMISTGKSLVSWGIVLFLVELLIGFIWKCIDSGVFDKYGY